MTRVPIPPQVQERARNAAHMASRVATSLSGYTTADGALTAEIMAKRAAQELRALLADIRRVKSDARRMEIARAKDRAIVERSHVSAGLEMPA